MTYITTSKVAESNIMILKERTYLSDSQDEFKHKFKEFQTKGTITLDFDFQDDQWILSNSLGCARLNFKINEVIWKKRLKVEPVDFTPNELLNALRCFTLLHLESMVVRSVSMMFHGILRLLEDTCFLANNDEVVREFRTSCKAQKYRYLEWRADKFLEFLDYFELLPIDKRYYQIIQDHLQNGVILQRALPTYESMFKFDRIISRFLNESKSNEVIIKLREKYYVIILWWFITTQIPLRTTEFTLIPYNCTKVENGKYKLIIRRSDIKGDHGSRRKATNTVDGDYRLEKIEINKALYDMIVYYKSIVDKYDFIEGFYGEGKGDSKQRPFLFSLRGCYVHLRSSVKTRKARYSKVLDYITPMFLSNLLRSFYYEVILMQYNLEVIEKCQSSTPYHLCENVKLQRLVSNRRFELKNIKSNSKESKQAKLLSHQIERIQNMDTRHFAIMNMILQDVPMVAVKILAGHEKIQTTYHYYSHLDTFVYNYTYHLAKKHAERDYSQENNPIVPLNSYGSKRPSDVRNDYYLTKIKAGEIKAKEVDNGWCLYKDDDHMPCLQVGFDCECNCDYFVPNEEGTKAISNAHLGNKSKIDISLKIIKELIKDRRKIKDFETYIRNEVIKISSYINQDSKMICSIGQVK